MSTSDELLAALREAATVAFRELAAVEVTVRDARATSDPDGFAEVSAVLEVATGSGAGYFVLSATASGSAALAKRVLTGTCAEPDEAVIRDCLGEVVNVIAGQAKPLLVGTPFHFTLGTPLTATGAPQLAEEPRLRLVCDCELGAFALRVRLPD